MERKMRRFKQQLPSAEARALLKTATNGILSLVDTDGAPYGVPLSFAYNGTDTIYFHSAVAGRKIDCLQADSRCSFCVVVSDDIRPEEFTTYFQSVIVSGKIEIVSSDDEVTHGLELLCLKYSPGVDSAEEINRCKGHVKVLKLSVESISGKEAIELVRRRKKDD